MGAPRDYMIEWLQTFIKSFGYDKRTYFLAFAYLDAVLAQFIIKSNDYKLLSYMTVYVAA